MPSFCWSRILSFVIRHSETIIKVVISHVSILKSSSRQRGLSMYVVAKLSLKSKLQNIYKYKYCM